MNNLGQAVNRDVLVENFDILYHALSELGTRVSVKTCEVHLQSLYDYMEVPIRCDLMALKYACMQVFAVLRRDGECARVAASEMPHSHEPCLCSAIPAKSPESPYTL